MTLMEQVADLQNRVADAQKARFRAEATRDAAQAAAEAALAELKRGFGVKTGEEACALLAERRKELAEIVNDLTSALDKIGL